MSPPHGVAPVSIVAYYKDTVGVDSSPDQSGQTTITDFLYNGLAFFKGVERSLLEPMNVYREKGLHIWIEHCRLFKPSPSFVLRNVG